MAEQENKNEYSYRRRYSEAFEGVVNTFEWLLLALILALVFRAFAVEPFQIPTGSMAETLRGVHYHIRCSQCGYGYEVGGDALLIDRPQCPSCGYKQPVGMTGPVLNGDRIFVLKCIYQFFQPKRWDAVVFKNPLNPRENYIKRLIGLPDETVQIIDGDVYIDGQIARKPLGVQQELWMCVYDNDYQPFGGQRRFAGQIAAGIDRGNRIWKQRFDNEEDSHWDLSAAGPTVFGLDAPAGRIHTLVYNSDSGNDFRAGYAYNADRDRSAEPICGDLMVRFFVKTGEKDGQVGAAIVKNGTEYIGRLEFDGSMLIEKVEQGQRTELRRLLIGSIEAGQSREFSFAAVDGRLVLRFGQSRLSADVPAEAARSDSQPRQPIVKIFGAGRLQLRHIAVFRDIYYISDGIERATEEEPFTLGTDEYFVCGDNSPNSLDGRLWRGPGKGNNGAGYREGIVPRDFMMGKAFFVYWSEAFSPAANTAPMIPNMDQFRLIAGGSEQAY